MIRVADVPCGQAGVVAVVFRVRRRHDQCRRHGLCEDRSLQRIEPSRIQVLDDLHQHGDVEARESRVAIEQGPLDQLDALAHLRSHLIHVQLARGVTERARGHIHPQDPVDAALLYQRAQEFAVPAPKIGHGARARSSDDLEDRRQPLVPQAGADLGQFFVRLGLRAGEIVVQEPGQRLVREVAPVLEIPRGDQVLLRVRPQPVAALFQKLGDLVVADPVVLVVVEHGKQDIEMRQEVLEEHLTGDVGIDVATLPPRREGGIQRDRRGRDVVAEGLEEAMDHRLPARGWKHRDVRMQWDGGRRELGSVLAAAVHRGAVQLRDRHAQERRRHIRPIVHVLGEREPIGCPAAHQRDGIDFEQQGGRAALFGGLRIEDMRLAEGQRDRPQVAGVLVQQVPEVGCRLMRGLDREKHGPPGYVVKPSPAPLAICSVVPL